MRAVVIILIVLVGGVIGLGFYRDWFTLTVDQDKIKADIDAGKETFKGKSTEAKGTVQTVEGNENRFTLEAVGDAPKVMYYVTDASKVSRNQEAGTFADLKAGDKVTVHFRENGEKKEATSVVITPEQSP
jgi:hypothetical protein